MNNIEWVITIGIFLAFVVWAFSFYTSFFPDSPTHASEFVDIINGKVLDFIMVDTYSVPIRVNHTLEETDVVLNFTYVWPGISKNSTRIYRGPTELPCQIIGDDIYFQSDLTNLTYNYFTMTYTNISMEQRCSGTFDIENSNLTFPWAAEHVKLLSQSKINEMTNQSYQDFKTNLSISRDFRIEINVSGTEINFGSAVPNNRNVYVKETFTKLEETNGAVDIRVLVW